MHIELNPPESGKTWCFDVDTLADLDDHIEALRVNRSLTERHPAGRDARMGRVIDALLAQLGAWRAAWVAAEVQRCQESWWELPGQSSDLSSG